MVKQDLNLSVKIDMLEPNRVGSSYPFPGFIHTQSHEKPTVHSSQELICGFNLA
jgi:hypothetical protein